MVGRILYGHYQIFQRQSINNIAFILYLGSCSDHPPALAATRMLASALHKLTLAELKPASGQHMYVPTTARPECEPDRGDKSVK